MGCVGGLCLICFFLVEFRVEVAEIVGDFAAEEVIGADEGITDASIDGLFGGQGRSAFNLLLMFEIVEFLYVKVASASSVYAADEEVFFNL